VTDIQRKDSMAGGEHDIEAAMVLARRHGATVAVFCELIGLLIEKGVLNQGDVIARYERFSNKMMGVDGGREAVQFADAVRDYAANEQNCAPS
jgi:hypothetical protein